MTKRVMCPTAPAPLEAYAREFDHLFSHVAQRCAFHEYLQGLLLPRERNKTITAIAGAEPVVGASDADVQHLNSFLAESTWDWDRVHRKRIRLLLTSTATASHERGALILDDSGDRKWGTKMAYAARQYLGSIGKVDRGIVAVTSVWADEAVYYPLHVQPYIPAERLPAGKKDPAFATKPELALRVVDAALDEGVLFRAVVADCAYGEDRALMRELGAAGLPYVVAIKPSHAVRAPEQDPHTPRESAASLAWGGADEPGDWLGVERTFRDGHTELWWATELSFGGRGPDKDRRLIVLTTDPATLPDLTTRYLETNLPAPGSPLCQTWPLEPAPVAEIARLYGLRNWIEQSYKQVKQELGWADFQVQSGDAIQRHWAMVCCAFAFCWWNWFRVVEAAEEFLETQEAASTSVCDEPALAGGEKIRRAGSGAIERCGADAVLATVGKVAGDAAAGAGMAYPVDLLATMVARLVLTPAAQTASTTRRRPTRRAPPQLVSPGLTDHR